MILGAQLCHGLNKGTGMIGINKLVNAVPQVEYMTRALAELGQNALDFLPDTIGRGI